MIVFILGFIIGFVAAIPVGPLNLFAISQVIKRDFFHGLLVGITAALLDAGFAFLAVTGFNHIVLNLAHLIIYMKIAAILLLLGIAYRLYKQSNKIQEIRKSRQNLIATAHKPILTSFFLYITNPAIYAFWIATAGFLSAHKIICNSHTDSLTLAISVGLGASLWYVILTKYVEKYHHQFKQSTFKKLFQIIAILLVCVAVYTFITIF